MTTDDLTRGHLIRKARMFPTSGPSLHRTEAEATAAARQLLTTMRDSARKMCDLLVGLPLTADGMTSLGPADRIKAWLRNEEHCLQNAVRGLELLGPATGG